MKKYNIGLDIGTTSVGWAVVNPETNKIMRKGNKKLWGVSLFDEASTAEERRVYRSTRRRYDRRRKRIKLLQEEFNSEIQKVDSLFFKKMKESFFRSDDSQNKTIIITSEERKKYKEYCKINPTIYHLREQLINNTEKADIRLVYLAIHHIIKYRGNFLYSSNFSVNNMDIKSKLKEIFTEIYNVCREIEFDECSIESFDYDTFENIMKIENKNDTKVELKNLFSSYFSSSFVKEIVKLLVGDKFDIAKLFNVELEEKLSISFKGTDYEDKFGTIDSALNEKIAVMELFKEIYDMIFLMRLFKGNSNTSISSLMVERYKKHKEDLKFLKAILKYDKVEYAKIFENENTNKNKDSEYENTNKNKDSEYEKKSKNKNSEYSLYINNKVSYDDFKKKFSTAIAKVFDNNIDQHLSDQYMSKYKNEIEDGIFLPRITDTDNGKYPFQLNKEELIKIINNQKEYYPFLAEEINDTYKIVKLLEFKIPYYVGPLNDTTNTKGIKNKNSWAVKRSNEVITPYNFQEVIDLDKSAEEFILRMISHCTYLLNEYAMPAESIMYSRYKVMNELKQIKVDGVNLTPEFQRKTIEQLFMKSDKLISNAVFVKYLNQTSDYNHYSELKVTGYSSDKGFANSMKSYCDFFGEKGIFINTSYKVEDAEEIISWITIFEDKSILEKKVRDKYIELDETALKKILSKRYKGWSSLSKKLLDTKCYKPKDFEEGKSILDLLAETNENFMQIINNKEYKIQKFIDQENNITDLKKLDYSVVEKLATSPSTKKGIYQTLKVIEELVDYMGYEPSNIILEMARGEEEKARKDRRKDQLLKLYEKAKGEIDNYKQLVKEINNISEFSLKYFLYFIQEGKSLYSGKKIDIDNLNSSEYQVDHILPRTLVKDNSIDNLALVLAKENQDKGAMLVLPREFRNQFQRAWWDKLKKNNLISPKKFSRLIRTEYSDEDIEGFINRQLVETRQITKHVANIIKNYHKDTKIVYINAGLSHDYREKFRLYKFRELNDFHHAHDAYLAAVLGNYKLVTYGENFDIETMRNKVRSLIENKNYKQLKYGFFINSLDNDMKVFDDETGEVKFDPEELNKIIENTLYQNDILVSKKTEIYTGAFSNETIQPKNNKGITLKDNLPTNLYGSYTSIKCSYMALVEYKGKKKLIGIPYLIDVKSNKVPSIKTDYIKEHLGLKKDETYTILKDKVPFNTLVVYKGHPIRVTGYSIAHKNSEASNEIQLYLKKDRMIEWKDCLNLILNSKKNKKMTDELYEMQMNEIFAYIIKKINEHYYLYKNVSKKITEGIDITELDLEGKKIVIRQLIIMLHANATSAKLKSISNDKFNESVGRITGVTITEGTIVYQSQTGLRKFYYEF